MIATGILLLTALAELWISRRAAREDHADRMARARVERPGVVLPVIVEPRCNR